MGKVAEFQRSESFDHLTAVSGVGSSPALATCKTSQVLLAGVSGGFPWVLRFAPPYDWIKKQQKHNPQMRYHIKLHYVSPVPLNIRVWLSGVQKVNISIMQTCPCNNDPLTPHFYLVKLGFTRVYIIFILLL